MRIIFVGGVEFSRHCLKDVISCGGDVVAVLTLPKERAAFTSDYADLSDIARENDIKIFKLKEKITAPENVSLIKSLNPDVIFIFGWSELITKKILQIPPLGCIGTHPTLLPLNRGRHPIIWALVNGLEESGLTFFFIDEGTDSGDILWQRPFSISIDDDAGSIYDKIKSLASLAIKDFLPKLKEGRAQRIPQDHTKATYNGKRGEKDGEIDWSNSTMNIHNLIRALAPPYVGAHTYLNGQKVKILKSRIPDIPSPKGGGEESGTVISSTDGRWTVRTGDGSIDILKWQDEPKVEISSGLKLG